MAADEQWQPQILEFFAYLRECGWTQPFLMFGRVITVVGVGPVAPRAANFNLRGASKR